MHPAYLLSVFFISGLISGVPILGALIPVSIIQLGLSSVASKLHIDLSHILWVVVPALLIGDIIGYTAGRYFHPIILKARRFNRYIKLFERTERVYQKYGGFAIILGRLTGPIRMVTPFLSGIMEVRYRYFILFDFLAAIVWCATHIIPAYLLVNHSFLSHLKSLIT